LERGFAPSFGEEGVIGAGAAPLFEPGSAGPEPAMLGHYTTGLSNINLTSIFKNQIN